MVTIGSTRRELWTTLVGGLLLSCVVSYRVATRSLVLGSPEGGWVYEYRYGFQPQSLAVFAIVWACCAVLAMVSLAEVRRREWRVVMMWLAVGLLSQAVLRALTAHTMEALFLGDGSNGFYQPTLQYRGLELLREFDRLRPALPEHPGTNMPGKLMLIYALELVSMRPAVLAWLVVAVSNLGGILLYLFVRDFLQDRETALLSLIFYLFVPAKLLFFPVLNTVTPVFALACAWLWMRLLQSQEVKYAVALGAAAYAVVFFEPTPSVMGLLFVFLTGYAMRRGDVGWRTVVSMSGIMVLAFISTDVLVIAVFRFNLVTTLQAIASHAVEFNTRVQRPYGSWVGQNLLDLAFGMGILQAVLFGGSVGGAFRHLSRRMRGADGRLAAFCLGTAVTILATDVAGINRGEVVRLWIFLACFAQVPAAYVCARLNSSVAVMLVLATTLLQVALSTSMLAFAQP